MTYNVSLTDEQVAGRRESWDGQSVDLTEEQVNLLLAEIAEVNGGTEAWTVSPKGGPDQTPD